jgi:hypothetical protein
MKWTDLDDVAVTHEWLTEILPLCRRTAQFLIWPINQSQQRSVLRQNKYKCIPVCGKHMVFTDLYSLKDRLWRRPSCLSIEMPL